MGDAALKQDEVDNLFERESVILKTYILKEIKLLNHDSESDTYFIKGIAALLKARGPKETRRKKTAKTKKKP